MGYVIKKRMFWHGNKVDRYLCDDGFETGYIENAIIYKTKKEANERVRWLRYSPFWRPGDAIDVYVVEKV